MAGMGRLEGDGSASAVAASIASSDGPSAAYLTDATLVAISGELRGASGKLRAQISPIGEPLAADSLPSGAHLQLEAPDASGGAAAPKAGIWRVAVAIGNAIKPVSDFNLISIRPRAEKQNGRVGLYFLGNWPGETGKRVAAPKAARMSSMKAAMVGMVSRRGLVIPLTLKNLLSPSADRRGARESWLFCQTCFSKATLRVMPQILHFRTDTKTKKPIGKKAVVQTTINYFFIGFKTIKCKRHP